MYMYMHWRAIPNNNWMAKPHRSGQVRFEGAMLVSSPFKSRTYICKLDGVVNQLIIGGPTSYEDMIIDLGVACC